MIEKKQKEIIEKIDSSSKIKRFKELENLIKNNKEYIKLKKEFDDNKEIYEKENRLNEEIIKYRKRLFEIEGVKEYSKLENEIRLLSKKVSKTISSIVEKDKC
ncbi:MAG: YlbF family regulator [Bacilli bacterium]|nr:YlbF family regulator [Bacilli bacterium]